MHTHKKGSSSFTFSFRSLVTTYNGLAYIHRRYMTVLKKDTINTFKANTTPMRPPEEPG